MEYNMGQVDAIAHIYCLRQCLGEGTDIVRWWKMPTGKCYFIQSITGATIKKNPIPKIITYREINPINFDIMLQNLVLLNIMEFQMDAEHGIMTNYNDFYYVALENGSSHSFTLLCGYHRDPRFNQIIDILQKNM
ncbi:MAG: hypothetical protein V7L14_05050 [Nostoc sp.]|uniref:hypothetical protein n=1 Tax=Nostoc sp. TaxID=1180 RepID=UPI002FFA75A5